MTTDVEELEKINLSEDDNSEVPPSDIVAYNELRSCADLFRLYNDKVLDIHPDFQRDIVWNPEKQTRFIDSLIKQLPIPSLCLTLDYKTEKRIVIDGLQRIQSIINFLDESEDWKLAKLEDIDDRISDKKVSEIKEKNSFLIERVKNAVLPITILRCDLSKESHANYLFTIFHRLNSGGTALNNQEIRNAIYSGNFNNFLKEANQYKKWRVITGINDNEKSNRFLKEELILRFFAFFENQNLYTGKLAKFLNNYMHKNRKISESTLADKSYYFYKTVDLIFDKITNGSVMDKTTNTVVEAIMVGVAKNLEKLNGQRNNEVKLLYDRILASDSFSQENLAFGLSGKDKVNNRLNTSINLFSE
jgi:hypothetical protein